MSASHTRADPAGPAAGALDIAGAIARGEITATSAAEAALERIAALNPVLNVFTDVTRERALAEAADIDERRRKGEALPALAGVPYCVKNLFDVKGLVTLAGSKINREHAPASGDAFLVERMSAAGAVLVGAVNMDEYAYGFTTENTHYGPTRNPHDTTRVAGGSSGGSGAALASGMTPLSLGTDTNGSIRVPSSFCGIFGIKPTYGRLSRRGAFPFCTSLDHVGPFARSVADLAACYDLLQGPDGGDPACANRAIEPTHNELGKGIAGLRIAVLGGWFEENAHAEALSARDIVTKALGVTRKLEFPEVARARASAFVITASESGNLHFPNLAIRPDDFEPHIQDRLLAGALVPSHWLLSAQRFRSWYRARVLEIFREVDIVIAPSTPFPATPIGTDTIEINGREVPFRPNVGVLTQPVSFIGLPVVAAPVTRPGKLPLGVQLIAAPWREDLAMRVAAHLEAERVCVSRVADPP